MEESKNNLAAVMTIGDEILIGQIIDTNSAWLGQELSKIGIKVVKIVSIQDDLTEIVTNLTDTLDQVKLLFVTGGLGPTKDDMTKVAIAKFLGVDMYFDEPTFAKIKLYFERINRPMSAAHDAQCLMPVGVKLLNNSMGTAPGMLFEHNGKYIISMPGIPYEMKSIMSEEVLPWIKTNFASETILHKTILTAGEGETMIENRIGAIISTFPPSVKIAYLPSLGQVRLRLSARGDNPTELQSTLNYYTELIVAEVSELVYGYDESNLETELGKLCKLKNVKIATAESCTGGNIAARIVSISGSSSYFMGSVVAYDNAVKTSILKVAQSTLDTDGAVSENTVIQMAAGVRKLLNVDVAVSVSGIAGSEGGTTDKPVGTIYICVHNGIAYKVRKLNLTKTRQLNIDTTTNYALNLMRKFIADNY